MLFSDEKNPHTKLSITFLWLQACWKLELKMASVKYSVFGHIAIFHIFILLIEIVGSTHSDGCGIEGLTTLGGK